MPEAIDAYREAARLMPENPEAHYWLGVTLSEGRKPQDALVALKEANRLNQKDWAVHAQLGVVLTRLGRNTEALAEFDEATRLSPQWTKSWPEGATQYDAAKAASSAPRK
jgi:Flp pilus assembly protein TadD